MAIKRDQADAWFSKAVRLKRRLLRELRED